MNHYETLGVKKTATPEEIKDAYKSLVKKYHPDVYPGDKAIAEKKIKEINAAYDVLSDPEQKKEYDELINPRPTSNYNTSYSYTPPKYNNYQSSYNNYRSNYTSNSNYSYENYRKTYNSQNSYDYAKRYTNYHRSKTPNSNYTNTNNQYSNQTTNVFEQYFTPSKLKVFFLILIIYIIFFIVNIIQVASIFGDNSSSSQEVRSSTPTTSAITEDHSTQKNPYLDSSDSSTSNYTTNNAQTLLKEFDINDYFSDSELRKLYNESYSDKIGTFEEFKDLISEFFYSTYIEPNN